jgi:ribosomal protein L24
LESAVQDKKLRLKKSSSIHISNVGLYDDAVKKAVKVKTAYHPETGEKFRISKKSGRILYKTKT